MSALPTRKYQLATCISLLATRQKETIHWNTNC